ncbi:MAG: hypothetical protein JWP88_779 [Flaviaesturariibacter sp.]|nr:hypothetical protein [Flaviaesturariibacter sp.]
MENLILLLASAFLFRRTEHVPKRIAVTSCGCTAELPSTPLTQKLEDEKGNTVFIGHAKEDSCTYGFATVELEHVIYDRAQAEQALFLFMEDMHPSFDIEYTTGLLHGYSHPHSDAVWGMTDYWQDADGIDWKVKGWTDGRILTVLYVKGIGSMSLAKQDSFLNSFQFNPTQKLVQ